MDQTPKSVSPLTKKLKTTPHISRRMVNHDGYCAVVNTNFRPVSKSVTTGKMCNDDSESEAHTTKQTWIQKDSGLDQGQRENAQDHMNIEEAQNDTDTDVCDEYENEEDIISDLISKHCMENIFSSDESDSGAGFDYSFKLSDISNNDNTK